MKKFAVLICVLTTLQGTWLSARPLSKKLIRTVIDAQMTDPQRTSSTVTNKGVFKQERPFTLHVNKDLYYQGKLSHIHETKLSCRGYALNANWLIIPATCLRQDNGKSLDAAGWTRGQRHIDIEASGADGYASNNHLLLVWFDKVQFIWPFVNVLAVSREDQLERLINFNSVLIRQIQHIRTTAIDAFLQDATVGGKLFQVALPGRVLRGRALDALMLASPDGNEFLLGYNTELPQPGYEQSSRYFMNPFEGSSYWYSLSEEDLEFIKATVLENRPYDWERIQNQLFLDNPVIPHFH